jgi:hypothetical protein
LLYSNPDDQKAAFQRLFFQKGMYVGLAEIPEDLIPDDHLKRFCASEYINAHVYNLEQPEICHEGLIHFLTSRQVVQEIFPGIFVNFLEEYKKRQAQRDKQ